MVKSYVLGDVIDTTAGLKFVQCSLVFQGDLAGRVLHWFHDENGQDELLWDHELDKIMLKHLTPDEDQIVIDEDEDWHNDC